MVQPSENSHCTCHFHLKSVVPYFVPLQVWTVHFFSSKRLSSFDVLRYCVRTQHSNPRNVYSMCKLDVCLSMHRCMCVEKKNQLNATEWFIALIICSTCFGHFNAHHQELETICVLLPPMVWSACLLVVGGQGQAASYASRKRGVARRATSLFPDA
jgi:predicted membrane protein